MSPQKEAEADSGLVSQKADGSRTSQWVLGEWKAEKRNLAKD